MSKIYLIVTILVLATVATVAGVFFYFNYKSPDSIVCTMEAKLCPDGSYVGRQGPKCEFTKCPDIIVKGIIQGKVTIGPICPVEREGVPCPVPPEAYTSREVILYNSNRVIVKRMHFLPNGTYLFEIPVGMYIIDIPKQGIGGSKDLPKTIAVKSGETVDFNFSIDTGIR
ncbi:MAG: hypothetical protein Q7S77_02740 [Candidatus Staskawiczbacteria bacterium]|nr:hypothetical protein [Candidatus Staskawiczbacteria bacterium]